MAKEEIKFVKKRGEKGVKQMFNEDNDSMGVKKTPMKRGQVIFRTFFLKSNMLTTDYRAL